MPLWVPAPCGPSYDGSERAATDRLILTPVNLESELEGAREDFLVVISSPPLTVRKGTSFQYPLTVRSTAGEVRYALEFGPAGMQVSDKGLVSWEVPRDFDGSQAAVAISIRDASGQEKLHSFRVRVR